LSLSKLKGQQIGQGAAFTSMMRQLGGSFGIALITTFMSRQNEVHRSALVSHLDTNNPAVQQRVQGMQQNFMQHGKSVQDALKSAYASLEGMVTKQASILSYMDVFFYLSIIFLICVPFVLMVKGNKGQKVSMGDAH